MRAVLSAFLCLTLVTVLNGSLRSFESEVYEACSVASDRAGPDAVLAVACTTTHLHAVVEAVGGEFVDVRAIVPFGMCPGHFDITPGEAARIRNADMLISHGFERFIDGLAPPDISGGMKKKIVLAHIKGNWMIPETHKLAAREIAVLLSDRRPDVKEAIFLNLAGYEQCIEEAVADLAETLNVLRGIPVVCSAMNLGFVEWLGLDVAATMPRDDDMSVKAMHEIILAGRAANVKMVVGNRQSAGKVGDAIARELGVPWVVLDNFPELSRESGLPSPYIRTLHRNCAAVMAALHKWRSTFDAAEKPRDYNAP